jgi:hypothetical protein
MKTTKMSLENIQGKLSRTEMKNIMAGSGNAPGWKCCWTGTSNCSSCVVGGTSCVTGATLTAC